MWNSEPDAKGEDRWYAVWWVQDDGASAAVPGRCRGTGLRDTVLPPVRMTGHQVAEVHAVCGVVQMQEAEYVPPSSEP